MLEVRGLTVQYGRIRAVDDASLEVRKGEIVALVGPNGAGKTSTLWAIAGLIRPLAGEIVLAGQAITGRPAHEIVRRGVAHVPEGRLIIAGMTVRENLLLGGYAQPRRRAERQLADVLARFPLLRERLDSPAGHLSGGQLQLLALARGLMAHPELLLLDEPSLGLAPLAVREVFRLIGALREAGTTILLVEQNVRQALGLADRAYLMEGGRILRAGPARALLESDLVMQTYLGVAPARREHP